MSSRCGAALAMPAKNPPERVLLAEREQPLQQPAPVQHLEAARMQAQRPDNRGRRPTSHERLTGLPWDASSHHGPAPWEVGRPQPAVARLASQGGFAAPVLEAGCGTGETALPLAWLGWSVLGVDVAETALAIARATAEERGIEVAFAAADALRRERLGAGSRRCWTAGCSTASTATSDQARWRAWRR